MVITRSHTPGDLFPQGETVVKYTATDPSGNNRTCDIHIVIKGIVFRSLQKSSQHLINETVVALYFVKQNRLQAVDF